MIDKTIYFFFILQDFKFIKPYYFIHFFCVVIS